MSVWSRFANVFRGDLNDDIDAELQSHFDEAQTAGRTCADTSRAFGSRLLVRESVRDAIVATWLESVLADALFGGRQLLKHKAVSAAAILSLALGFGSCLAAFRLIEAIILRPLPVSRPERFHVLTVKTLFEGEISTLDQLDYPTFRVLRAAVKDQAELMAIGFPGQIDLTFGSDQEMERVYRQFISGSTFGEFGLQPALGRLLTESDDLTPEAHPVAVISWDYWSRRFGKDSGILGRRFRTGNDTYQVIGVAPKGFTGTDPGHFTDVFAPSMMDTPAIYQDRNSYRVWVSPKPGESTDRIRDRLSRALHSWREARVKSWSRLQSIQSKAFFVTAPVALESAAAGRSSLQRSYSFTIFFLLASSVLLIACVNMANLMTAQAAVRARELALRVSIGAGRARLIRLVLMESGLIAIAASVLGLAFSWWASPFIAGKLNPPDDPVRLTLEQNWRVTIFALGLTVLVTLLSGLAPALRASSIKPSSGLKGGESPHARRRLMSALIAAQAAFCFFVLFVAGLFISTFEKMANQPTGFSSSRILTLESVSKTEQSPDVWYQGLQQIKSRPGVESAALAEYALMSNRAQTAPVWANGHLPDGTWSNSTWFLGVSPGWFDAMKLQILDGRDFRWDDEYPRVAIVNEKFARRYFDGQSPVGRTFETPPAGSRDDTRVAVKIIGLARDARYEDMRLPIPATAFVPFRAFRNSAMPNRKEATFIVRTKGPNPLALASLLRRDVMATRPGIRVVSVVTQEELVQSQMVGERLRAALAVFFAAVALILAAVGLYGVLNYAVLERRRELGIRIALGAPSGQIVRSVTLRAAVMLLSGSVIGIGFGLATGQYVEKMLYQVKGSDPAMLTIPLLTLLCAAGLAAVPPVFRAVCADPTLLLRSE